MSRVLGINLFFFIYNFISVFQHFASIETEKRSIRKSSSHHTYMINVVMIILQAFVTKTLLTRKNCYII
jgi:hypothetical protein